MNQVIPMKPSELPIFLSAKSYDKKTAESCRNCYDVQKRIVPKLPKIPIPNFDSINGSLE